MALRCKPGDLAVVVNPQYKENLGLLVEVIEPFKDFPLLNSLWVGLFPWKVKSLGRKIYTPNRSYMEGPIHDEALKPIRPDAEPDSVTTTRELAEQ